MLLTAIFIFVFTAVAFQSTVHVLGLWLVLLITHGIFVQVFGEVAIHLPLYAGVISALIILVKRDWKGVDPSILWLIGLLFFFMAISALQGMAIGRSLSIMMLYAKVFLLAILIIGCVRDEKNIKVMTVYCIAGLIVGALYAVYQSLTGQFSVSNIYVQRAAGLRADPNDTAMLLLSGVPLSVYWLFQLKSKALKIIPAISIVVLLIGIVLTGSRGGFVALALIFLAIYLKRPTIIATFVAVFIMVLAVTLAPDSYKERIESLVTGQEKHGSKSLESRSKLLSQGLTVFMNHPVLGVGAGNFGAAFMESLNSAEFSGSSGLAITGNTHLAAHNMYLEFFVENGIIGGGLLISIFLLSIIKLMKFDRENRQYQRSIYSLPFCILLALLGMYFAGLFLSQGKNSVLWFIIGLGLSITNIKVKNNHEGGIEGKDKKEIKNNANEYMPRLRKHV